MKKLIVDGVAGQYSGQRFKRIAEQSEWGTQVPQDLLAGLADPESAEYDDACMGIEGLTVKIDGWPYGFCWIDGDLFAIPKTIRRYDFTNTGNLDRESFAEGQEISYDDGWIRDLSYEDFQNEDLRKRDRHFDEYPQEISISFVGDFEKGDLE